MIIAIDGPAASGKGTLARRIAHHLGLIHLDTGLLYRAVARDMKEQGLDLEDAAKAAAVAADLDLETLEDPELRAPGLGDAASVVAKHQSVRERLLKLQQDFAHTPPGAVLDGRDIGTVVCPDADVKIYVTASSEVRARRRFNERMQRGDAATYEGVLADIRRRDERDAARDSAPMRPATDAVLLDTSDLDIEAAFDQALGVIHRKVGRPG